MAVLLLIHSLHVIGVVNRYPFHSLDMFRTGPEQQVRSPVLTIATPVLLDPETCSFSPVLIRAEHGLQPAHGLRWPSFLLRWDNTATYPLRYDVGLDDRLAVVAASLPNTDALLVPGELSYDYNDGAVRLELDPADAGFASSASVTGCDPARLDGHGRDR